MSAGQITVGTPARTRVSLLALAVIAAFAVGIATGGLATWAASNGAGGQQVAAVATDTSGACASPEFTNYRRLLGNMRAAADRHDIRAYVGYRNDLASLIRNTGTDASVVLVGAIEVGCWD